MNIKTKKIVAREFLILITCMGIGVLTFLGIYPYNFFKKREVERLQEQISLKRTQADSLSKLYRKKTEKQIQFTEKYVTRFDLSRKVFTNAKVWNRLYEIARSDSVKYKWEHAWKKVAVPFLKEIDFETPEKFQTFILGNIVTAKDVEQNRAAKEIYFNTDALQNKMNEASRQTVSIENQLRTAAIALAIAFFVLFVLRFIYYGLKWSISTLRQPSS